MSAPARRRRARDARARRVEAAFEGAERLNIHTPPTPLAAPGSPTAAGLPFAESATV